MRLDKFTIKSQEALTAAQQIAEQHEHQQIEPEHLLLAVVQQDEGIAKTILKKLGAEPQPSSQRLKTRLKSCPKYRAMARARYTCRRGAKKYWTRQSRKPSASMTTM